MICIIRCEPQQAETTTATPAETPGFCFFRQLISSRHGGEISGVTDEERAIHNERTKLVATYFNNLAVALIAVGALAPLVGRVVGSSALHAAFLFLLAAVCILASIALHYSARRTLGRLKP
jgi:MFS-type transporter involved in bile tolerance (Atg22 family)